MQLTLFLIIIGILGLIFFYVQSPNFNLGTTKEIPPLTQIPQQILLISPTPSQQRNVQNTNEIAQTDLQTYRVASATAVIKTTKGDITLILFGEEAPNTVANFIKKAKDEFYNNLIFHRVEGWVIQGGDPKGNGTGGGSIPVEFNTKPFVTGSLGVASRGDGQTQNDAQFFITKSEASWLNGKYTNFGMVTEGMETVEKITIGDQIIFVIIK